MSPTYRHIPHYNPINDLQTHDTHPAPNVL